MVQVKEIVSSMKSNLKLENKTIKKTSHDLGNLKFKIDNNDGKDKRKTTVNQDLKAFENTKKELLRPTTNKLKYTATGFNKSNLPISNSEKPDKNSGYRNNHSRGEKSKDKYNLHYKK